MIQPNTLIGDRYLVQSLLGQGGMSDIYLCLDQKENNRQVALKGMVVSGQVSTQEQTALELFQREADILSKLNHPSVPKIYNYFQMGSSYYMVLEYIPGQDLQKILENTTQPQDEATVLKWAITISTTLYYLHRHTPPILFRDVKPSNIIIEGDRARLIDFGIARRVNPSKPGDTMKIGSPGYAPPEQYKGNSDPRSDIYALSKTMHYALTLVDPTEAQDPFATLPLSNYRQDISQTTQEILLLGCALDPDKRFEDMLSFKKALQLSLKELTESPGSNPSHSSTPASPDTTQDQDKNTPPKLIRRAQRPSLPLALTLLVAVVALPQITPTPKLESLLPPPLLEFRQLQRSWTPWSQLQGSFTLQSPEATSPTALTAQNPQPFDPARWSSLPLPKNLEPNSQQALNTIWSNNLKVLASLKANSSPKPQPLFLSLVLPSDLKLSQHQQQSLQALSLAQSTLNYWGGWEQRPLVLLLKGLPGTQSLDPDELTLYGKDSQQLFTITPHFKELNLGPLSSYQPLVTQKGEEVTPLLSSKQLTERELNKQNGSIWIANSAPPLERGLKKEQWQILEEKPQIALLHDLFLWNLNQHHPSRHPGYLLLQNHADRQPQLKSFLYLSPSLPVVKEQERRSQP